MTIRPLPIVAACALVALAACHPKSVAQVKDEMIKGGVHVSTSEPIDAPVTVADTLTCPDEEGALKLTGKAKDGLSCTYTSDKGQVELSRVADDGAGLAPIKASLDALLPGQAAGGTINVVSEKGPDGREKTNVDMPFLHVADDGQRSHVKILGMTIDADSKESDRKAHAIPTGPHGRELVYVLAGDGKATGGYNAVGYVARGGESGPLVVAAFKYAKGDEWNHGDDHHDHDLDALLDLNAKKGPSADKDASDSSGDEKSADDN